MRTIWLRPLLVVMVSVAVAVSCVTAAPPKARLLPFEKIHKKVRKYLELGQGQRLASCGDLVFYGQSYPPFGEYDELMAIVLADGPASYFDNRTGKRIAQCGYWYCTNHNNYCDRSCPPREWFCEGLEIEPPASKLLEPARAQ